MASQILISIFDIFLFSLVAELWTICVFAETLLMDLIKATA